MKTPQSAPKRAPEYNLIRFVTANDAGPYTKQALGCNFGSFLKGMIQVVPINTPDIKNIQPDALGDLLTGATSNPALALRYWNNDLGLYLPHNPAQTIAAAGAGVASEFEVDVYGRNVLIEVTGGVTAGQAVLIFASGCMHHESL